MMINKIISQFKSFNLQSQTHSKQQRMLMLINWILEKIQHKTLAHRLMMGSTMFWLWTILYRFFPALSVVGVCTFRCCHYFSPFSLSFFNRMMTHGIDQWDAKIYEKLVKLFFEIIKYWRKYWDSLSQKLLVFNKINFP